MTQDARTGQGGSRARRLAAPAPPAPAGSEEESLAAIAYRKLEERIVTLRLAPGEAITESRLAEALGMGRTPVREAIQRLAWEGLVTIRPRLGILVTDVRPGDFTRVLDARHALEVLLAGASARNASQEARNRLAICARNMAAAADAGDTEEFLRQDKSFDEIVARAADNPFAARVVAPLQTHSRRFWFRHFGKEDLAAAALSHTRLMQAIAGGDPALAHTRADDLMAALQQRAASLA
jgi:DNA-binding GntR family transcriptional regulator